MASDTGDSISPDSSEILSLFTELREFQRMEVYRSRMELQRSREACDRKDRDLRDLRETARVLESYLRELLCDASDVESAARIRKALGIKQAQPSEVEKWIWANQP